MIKVGSVHCHCSCLLIRGLLPYSHNCMVSGSLLSVYSVAYFSGFVTKYQGPCVHVFPSFFLVSLVIRWDDQDSSSPFPLLCHLSSSCFFSGKCFAIAQWRMLELFLYIFFSRLLLSSCEIIHEGDHASYPLARYLCTWWFVEGTHLLYVQFISFPFFCW